MFKKNIFYYGRNWKGTCCEILVPIILLLLIIYLRNLIDVLEFDEITYPPIPVYTSVNDILSDNDNKDSLLKNIIKDCS